AAPVNRRYGRRRELYARLLKAGETLREAQLSALKGRAVDLRAATITHRQAVSEAVKAAVRIAAEAGARPDGEQLARMFEAVSLQQRLPEPAGRLSRALQ